MRKKVNKTNKVNKANPKVEILLGGKKRALCFDLNAMTGFEEATGNNLLDGSFKGKDMTAGDIKAMLWACLISDGETVTQLQVGTWVTLKNIKEVGDKLNSLFEASMPEDEGESAPLVEKPQAG